MPNRTGFQTFVNNELPVAVPGDFASVNPHASILGGQGAFVAGALGLTVGVFGFFDPVAGVANNYYKPGTFIGFVHRENQGLITLFLGIATMQVVPGNMVTGQDQGDFFGLFLAGATAGQKIYADPLTGALTANATGNGVSGVYTTTAVASGVMTTTDANLTGSAAAVGQIVTGGTLPEGTYIASADGTGSGTHLWILANLNGTAIPDNVSFTATVTGVIETNFVAAESVAAAATSSAASLATTGILTIGGSVTGLFLPGMFVSGANIPVAANMQILYQITGTTGIAGTYQTSYNALVTSEAMAATPGQVGAITSWGVSH